MLTKKRMLEMVDFIDYDNAPETLLQRNKTPQGEVLFNPPYTDFARYLAGWISGYPAGYPVGPDTVYPVGYLTIFLTYNW